MPRWRLSAGRQGMANMFCVYILQLSDKSFYKGQTENIDKRMFEHALGYVRTTKNKQPFNLIHVELCKNRLEARSIEKYFKSGFGREIIQEIAEVAEWQTRRSQKPMGP